MLWEFLQLLQPIAAELPAHWGVVSPFKKSSGCPPLSLCLPAPFPAPGLLSCSRGGAVVWDSSGAGSQRGSGGQLRLFLKRERPRPNGLVTQRRLAEGVEGAPAAPNHDGHGRTL